MWTGSSRAHSSHPRTGRTGAAQSWPVQLVGIVSTGFELGMEPGTWALFLVWWAPFPLAAERTLGSTRASHLVELYRREQGFGRDKRTYHCSINGLITECCGSQGAARSDGELASGRQTRVGNAFPVWPITLKISDQRQVESLTVFIYGGDVSLYCLSLAEGLEASLSACLLSPSQWAKLPKAEGWHRKWRGRQVFRRGLECPDCSADAYHLVMLGPRVTGVLSPVQASWKTKTWDICQQILQRRIIQPHSWLYFISYLFYRFIIV